jgi:Ni,Fe-hydrogenase III large subunit
LGNQLRASNVSLLAPRSRSIHFMGLSPGQLIAHAALLRLLEPWPESSRPPRRRRARIALELERIANHVGDLGALAGDVAFLPTMSYCGRIRGDFLNMSAAICGNRFGRNLVRPGGTAFDIPPSLAEALLARLNVITPEAVGAVDLIWRSPSTTERFEGTGKVSEADCLRFGFVGPAARASGLEMDVRFDHPWGAYRFEQIPVSSSKEGDVFARALVRDMEIRRSADFVKSLLENLIRGREAHSAPQPARRLLGFLSSKAGAARSPRRR